MPASHRRHRSGPTGSTLRAPPVKRNPPRRHAACTLGASMPTLRIDGYDFRPSLAGETSQRNPSVRLQRQGDAKQRNP